MARFSRIAAIPRAAKDWTIARAGGPARLQIIVMLAGVLALAGVDLGTTSAVADQLEHAFHVGNTGFALLISIVSFIGAAATLPMGILADRVPRRMVLMVAVAGWTTAEAVSGTATSYAYLLVTRLCLGAVTSAAWPCVASLSGDFFPARERAGIYGLMLAGELIGTGIGFFVSGELSSLAGWRWSFFAMAVPSAVFVWLIWRYLPEPARGSQAWLAQGENDPAAASQPKNAPAEEGGGEDISSIQQDLLRSQVHPREELVLHEDPTRFRLWRAIGYLLRVPTYLLLIIASSQPITF